MHNTGALSEAITSRLSRLPRVKAGKMFDQKITAAFALELEHEIQQKNRSWLKKNNQESMPEPTFDLARKFL